MQSTVPAEQREGETKQTELAAGERVTNRRRKQVERVGEDEREREDEIEQLVLVFAAFCQSTDRSTRGSCHIVILSSIRPGIPAFRERTIRPGFIHLASGL